MKKINDKKHELWCDLCGTLIVQGTEQACAMARHYEVTVVERYSKLRTEKLTDIDDNPVLDENGEQLTHTYPVPAKKSADKYHFCPRCWNKLAAQIEETNKQLTKAPRPKGVL